MVFAYRSMAHRMMASAHSAAEVAPCRRTLAETAVAAAESHDGRVQEGRYERRLASEVQQVAVGEVCPFQEPASRTRRWPLSASASWIGRGKQSLLHDQEVE